MNTALTYSDHSDDNRVFVLSIVNEITKYCKSIKHKDTKLIQNIDELDSYKKDSGESAVLLSFEYYTSERNFSDMLFEMHVTSEGILFLLLNGLETYGFDFKPDMSAKYVVDQAKFTIKALLDGQIFMQITHKKYRPLCAETIIQYPNKTYKVITTSGLGYPRRISDNDIELIVVRNGTAGRILKKLPKEYFLIEKYEDGRLKQYGREIDVVPSKPLYKKDFFALMNNLQIKLIADNPTENIQLVLYKRWETWAVILVTCIVVNFIYYLLAVGISVFLASVFLRPWILRNKRGNDIVQKKLSSLTSGISFIAAGYSIIIFILFLKDSILDKTQQPESFWSAGYLHKELYLAIAISILVFIILSYIGMHRWLLAQFLLIASSMAYITYLSEKYFDTETYINSTQEELSGWLLAISIVIMLCAFVFAFIQNRTENKQN